MADNIVFFYLTIQEVITWWLRET